MTDGTAGLVLELLRGMRADMDGRFTAMGRRFTAIDERPTGIDERRDATGIQLEARRCVFVAPAGSLVSDIKDYETRLAALEGTPA